MSKPVGGRGHKAPYQTMIVRIPINVKEQVEEIVERFRSGDLEVAKIDDSDLNRISQLTAIIERYTNLSNQGDRCDRSRLEKKSAGKGLRDRADVDLSFFN